MLSLIFSAILAATPTSTATVDLNHASVQELAALPGVGPVLAARIVEKRPYAKALELLRVHGIGPKKLARMRDRLRIDPPRASKPRP